MLSDFERKVLRIAYNYQKMGQRPPSYREWRAKTGHPERDVRAALQKLVDLGYMEWVSKDVPLMNVKQGWEVNYPLK